MPLSLLVESYHPTNNSGFGIVADSDSEAKDLKGGHERGTYGGVLLFDANVHTLFFLSAAARDFALNSIKQAEDILA